MSPTDVGIIGFVVLFLLFLSGMPIGFVMLLVGFLGYSYLVSITAGISVLGFSFYSTLAYYPLSVIPLFLLMGQFASSSGIVRDLYNTAYKWLGNMPGGLAIATIGGCAGFAALTGSSVAASATMCVVALPQMLKHKYDSKLAVGTIAAGGTLGILIPPSIAFVIYAIVTKESIGKLLLAGFIPGLLLAFLFMLTIYVRCRRNPDLGPPGPSVPLKEKILALKDIWAALVLFLLVIGGLYLGIFVPSEAAAVGAFGALVIGLANRSLSRQDFFRGLFDTARLTAMIFVIIFGANVFGYFVARTKIPFLIVGFINGLAMHRLAILAVILFIYVLLGCVMEAYAMIVLTLPIYFPLILTLGFDPIWYGVLMVIMIEMGMITPPVGLNVYVVHGVARDVPLMDIFRGALPFVIAMVICIIILVAFPQVALFLPNTMK